MKIIKMCSDYFQKSTLHKLKFFKANILSFGLSISNLRQPNLGKYIQISYTKVSEYPKKNCEAYDFQIIF